MSVRLPRALLAPRSQAPTAAVAALLSLGALLPAAAFPCGAPHPDNTTAAKLLGTWLYVAGAAQFPQHVLEMLLIDHGYLHVEPHTGGQELLITQRVAVGDQCLTNNSTYFEISTGNGTLVKHTKTQQTVGTLVNLSSEDLLLIQYQLQRERTYLGLYLYARNLSLSTRHREEFEQQCRSQGLGTEAVVYAPWSTLSACSVPTEAGGGPGAPPGAGLHRSQAAAAAAELGSRREGFEELCQVKEMGKGNSPHMEATVVVTAPPPPATHQPRSTDN